MKSGGSFKQAAAAGAEALTQIAAGANPASVAPAGAATSTGSGGGSASSSPWMHQTGGYNALSDADKEIAERNYADWSEEEGHTFGLEEYVQYAQDKQAERMGAANESNFTPEDEAEIERLSRGEGAA
jgi:hypothetical protein